MKEEIKKEISEILKTLGVENPTVNFDVPAHFELGDYSTSVAMVYAKQLGKKPFDLAEEIKNKLEEKKISGISKIESIAPGFINFFFDKYFFEISITEELKMGDKVELEENLKGQKIVVEHTQPNPFKEFHIGHLMNNAIGESVARILRANGAEVITASYHGDKGLHVAKAVWAIRKQNLPLLEAYAFGHKAYEDDEKAKEEITVTNKEIYDESNPEINKIYKEGWDESFKYFELMYEKLDSHFDNHFYENISGEVGKKLVLENVGKVFEKSDGAVVFKGENFEPKTHTRVFLTKDDLPTYEAKELGLAEIKKEAYSPYHKSITVTANEQNSFFNVVEVAIGEVFPELKGKLKHLSHGLLKLPTGKMSSRTGTIISAESLINQVKEKVFEKIKDREFGEKEKDGIAEAVAIGAIKYMILRQAIGGDIIFDFDKSISFEGDSGPYLQYATVRAKSVLQKAKMSRPGLDTKIPEGWQTTNLERLLERFPSVVEKAGKEYAPHYIATYLIELSGEFNSFYASHKIIDEADSTSSYRLALTQAFVNVMTSGLNLLGVKVPSQM